ncbi:hypothetical protein R69919_04263 [Paraburkholderia gardini]|uniref:Uncharacterized protein n=1 Tax=Paraburkholderia gardini TaxID=2823469 RepID=A0ABN7QRY8_9BURK|nr:hypothetical protein R54767_03397 [Paraburkholderia gardini]CAG4915039.1 hypothetical protein R69919_04263 [Paraburkholderia gardini]
MAPLTARANLDEHQRAIAITHHEVDLAASTQHVARNEAQTLTLQESERVRFECRSDDIGPLVS